MTVFFIFYPCGNIFQKGVFMIVREVGGEINVLKIQPLKNVSRRNAVVTEALFKEKKFILILFVADNNY